VPQEFSRRDSFGAVEHRWLFKVIPLQGKDVMIQLQVVLKSKYNVKTKSHE
jgi:hypothetical protein